MVKDLLKSRIEELGISHNDVVLRYCAVLTARGEEAKPVTKRSMIYRVLSGETVPRLDIFLDIIAALGGEVKIIWKRGHEVPL